MKILSIQTIIINKYAERATTPYKNKYIELCNQEFFIIHKNENYQEFLVKYMHIIPVKFNSLCERIQTKIPYQSSTFSATEYFTDGIYFDTIYDQYYIIHNIII